MPAPMRRDEGYAPLEGYATIGDGRTVALVAPDGQVDWLPLPNLDSMPPFAALLDAEHGGFVALRPEEDDYTVERTYRPGTAVLESTYTTPAGRVRVTDSLNVGVAGRLPWAELARRIDGLEGTVRMRGVVRPGTCLNTASPWIGQTVHGQILRVADLTMAPRTLNDAGVEVSDREIRARYLTEPGSRHVLAVVATSGEPVFLPRPEHVDDRIDHTVSWWQRWSGALDLDLPWREEVTRSIVMLKLLLYAPSGAMVAAATTSLPESPAGGKNWDYRFAWIRDTAYALTVLFRLGAAEETHAAMSWLLRLMRQDGSVPGVLYTLEGEVPGNEVTDLDVPGWRGIGPVRVGNQATAQLQLGVFGDVFNIVQLYVDNGNLLDAGTARLMSHLADVAADRWRSKDSGMWELTHLRHYTTSKLGCWLALTHAAHLADIGQIDGAAHRWRFEAEEIRRWVETNAWDPDLGAYVWYPGSQQLDASILLHAISGFDRGPRMSSTLDALRRELGPGPHLYRYSGAQDEEGAFVACSYWMVSALALVGRVDEARALMDELVAVPNELGVLTEMVDPVSGAFLGNLPQALSHLALLHAAVTVANGSGPGH